MISVIYHLLKKDILLELRQKHVLQGMLLHTVALVYVTYLSFNQAIPLHTWNALLWIILLFSAIHSVSRTFAQDSPARQLYYYTLCRPVPLILSKILYNLILVTLLSFLCCAVFILFNGNLIILPGRFILVILMGSWGFASLLTLVSAIAAQGGHNFTLMSILSLPVILPLILILIRFSLSSLSGAPGLPFLPYFLALLLLNILGPALAVVLFPYLWKE